MGNKLGEKLFLIADERSRASEISFYLRDKRVEGPGHPAGVSGRITRHRESIFFLAAL